MDAAGKGLTVTTFEAVFAHNCALVAVTTYVAVEAGLTVIEGVVSPVLHR